MARVYNASGMADRTDAIPALRGGYRQIRETIGISFTVPELMILSAWAEFHQLRMVIELDTVVDGAAYEEVVALYAPGDLLRRWTLWRAREGVVVEPRRGAACHNTCMAELLEGLLPEIA